MDNSAAIIYFFAGIFVVGGLLFALMTVTRKGPRRLNQDIYRSKWLAIEQQLKRDEPSSYQLSVLNADKLVDQSLRDRGLAGQTMGERLKNAPKTFSQLQALWNAHKLRNQIAHETTVNIGYDDARRALAAFKQALKDVGAI